MNEARHDELVDQLKANQERWEANKTAWETGNWEDPFAYKRKAVLTDEGYAINAERKTITFELALDYYDTKHNIYTYDGFVEAVETGAWERKAIPATA